MANLILNTDLVSEDVKPVEDLGRRILEKFKHALIIDFEAVPNGEIFHVGAIFDAPVKSRNSKIASTLSYHYFLG